MTNLIAALQMTSSMDVSHNLSMAQSLLQQAAQSGARVAVLPEMFPMLGMGPEFLLAKKSQQETYGDGPLQSFLSTQAKALGMWIIGGTIPLKSHQADKCFASTLVYKDNGEEVARYDKINMFDVDAGDGITYRESDSTLAGDQTIVVQTPIGKIGLAVCFDIRFPALFQQMKSEGAEIFAIPAAFTVPTGKAHWEILMRALAVQNFAYVVGAAQFGIHGMDRKTFGDSIIINPNGEIMASLADGTGMITAEIDLQALRDLRKRFPAYL